jgi:hypothetical protein
MTSNSKPKQIVLTIGPIERLASLIRKHDPGLAQEYASIRNLLEVADSATSRPGRKGRKATEEEESIADTAVRAWADGKSAKAIVRDLNLPWLKLDRFNALIHSTLIDLVTERPEFFSKGDWEDHVNVFGEPYRLLDYGKRESSFRPSLKAAFDQGWRRGAYFPDGLSYLDRPPTLSR